ncbi:type IV pilus assembly protein PilQ [Desulfosarcina sp. BuS5]|uniref:type IV pilus secretin PilQ n=1 Tax=Desulfosarcina sp. BuS5 TaxID=933262 RepID=UPI00048855F2|nr:type IV pilus secretin PilQ [Desulfosarcina sp. BuS5]WDN88113.1 type IV pilus assembly protein PilQ [Desulfosarcina sp. BuS5]
MKHKKCKLSQAAILCGLLIILISGTAGCASRNITMHNTGQEGIDDSVANLKLITGISTSERDGTVVVHVNSDGGLTYSSIKQPLPLSVILYFPETALKDSIAAGTKENSIIGSVKASELPGTGHTSRIMIPLNKDVDYEVVSEDTGLRIIFSRPAEDDSRIAGTLEPDDKAVQAVSGGALSAADGIAEAPAASAGKKSVDKHILSLLDKGNPPVDIKKAVAGTVNPDIAWVNRIDFSSEDAGKSTIIVGTTRPVEYKIEKAGNKRLNLRLGKTKIPPYHHRPLITTRFASAVDRITPVQTPALKNTSLLSIELRESVPYFVEQSGNLLFIHFEPSSIPPRPLEKADLPPWKTVLAQTAATAAAYPQSAGGKASAEKLKRDNYEFDTQDMFTTELKSAAGGIKKLDYSRELGGERRYVGEKIAVNFYKTDIQNVFRIISEVSNKNFAFDKDITGTVSLVLDNPIPWDELLDLVLEMNQLGKVETSNVVRIATIKTLSNACKEQMIMLQTQGAKAAAIERTKMEAELRKTVVTKDFKLDYAKAATVEELLQDEKFYNIFELTDKNGGKQLSVALDERNNMLLVTAPPIIIERVDDLIKKIDTPVPQVMIAARIVEVTEDFSRAIGVDWGVSGDLNKVTGGDFLDYNLAFDHAVAGTSAVGTTFRRLVGSNLVLNAQLTVEQSNGNAKIISTPKVITMDNETATIKQGKEFPYLERDDTGGSSTKFKDVDLSLEVTPQITPKNRISLELKITKNDISGEYGGVPIVSTKEVESTLLVKDGDTIVIGGVIQSTLTESEIGTPWLSKVPILGWFFKSKSNKSSKGELLIFITPTVFRVDELLET